MKNPASAGFFVAAIFAVMKLYAWRILEALAVAANLAFTWLYLRQSEMAFAFGVIGPLLLLVLALRARIYADAFLQITYALLAVYGWMQLDAQWSAQTWTLNAHLLLLIFAVVLSWLTGRLLKLYTQNALPYLDGSITCFALAGTWLMMHFVHENWLYFIAVNAASTVLYARRKLYIGAGMFAVYLLMAIDGYFRLGIFS